MEKETSKRMAAAVDWFTMDLAKPHLIGSQCKSCNSFFFPKETVFCRNPKCAGATFEEVLLSRTGKLWSFTVNSYQPPFPFKSPDPFRPYAIAAVELLKERMVVMGQVPADVDTAKLKIGMNMELVLGTLYEDELSEFVVWKWKPVL